MKDGKIPTDFEIAKKIVKEFNENSKEGAIWDDTGVQIAIQKGILEYQNQSEPSFVCHACHGSDICQNPEPSQEKQNENHSRLLNENPRGRIGAEWPKRSPAILPEDNKIPTDDMKIWRCVGCGNKTEHHGIPFTACEKCQPIIKNFVKARVGMADVFRSVVERQMEEKFKALLDRRIAIWNDMKIDNRSISAETMRNQFLEELNELLKEMIK